MMVQEFEPRIIGFLCNWCSYAGADLAGVSRFQYPPNVRVIRVMCSGRLDPVMLMDSLLEGVDGVLIGGCHLGDCHYLDGNYHAERKIRMTKSILEKIGFQTDRLNLQWVSASEGQRFASVVSDFVAKIKELGPSKIKEDEQKDLRFRLEAARNAVRDKRLRELIGHEFKVTVKGNVYGNKIPEKRWEELMTDAIDSEIGRHLVLKLITGKEHTVKSMASALNIPADKILKYVVSLRMENLIAETGHEGMSPTYVAALEGD
jgi:coenzyme F420-reducing hydrogenase delta subunit